MEGAFPSPFKDNEKPFILIEQAAIQAKQKPNLKIAIDAAASEFYKKNLYNLKSEKKHLTFQKLSTYYHHLTTNYPIYSIEDPFDQDDWAAWKAFTKQSKKTKKQKLNIVADDLLTTNPTRIKQAIQRKACNALLVKPNQIGTITETLQAIGLAKKAKWYIIISHRSGDSSDPFIADLAVGTAARFIKTGAPSRSERLAKYNRLLEIEQELGKKAIFQGKDF
jgi:enolase